MRWRIVLTAIMLSGVPVAHAGIFEDGNALNDLCKNGTPNAQAMLRGYVMAVTDGENLPMTVINDTTGEPVMPRQLLCMPDGVDASQVEDLTCNYLTAHPEKRQLPGHWLVVHALMAAWPCPKK